MSLEVGARLLLLVAAVAGVAMLVLRPWFGGGSGGAKGNRTVSNTSLDDNAGGTGGWHRHDTMSDSGQATGGNDGGTND